MQYKSSRHSWFYGPNGIQNTGFTTPESVELQNIFNTLNKGGLQI